MEIHAPSNINRTQAIQWLVNRDMESHPAYVRYILLNGCPGYSNLSSNELELVLSQRGYTEKIQEE